MPQRLPSILCIGSGDAFGSGGRLHSCYYINSSNGQFLFDCGCSSLIGMQRCGVNPAEIDTVIISHLHGDHFGGIPYLLLEAKYISQRTRPLILIGPQGLQQRVEAVAAALYPGLIDNAYPFPIIYRELNPHRTESLGSARLRCFDVKHDGNRQAYGLRLEISGKIISYTGDTEWTDNLLPLAQGSDVLIAECFAYDHAIPGHLDYQTLLKQRDRLASKHIVLTHLGAEMLAQRETLVFETLNDGDLIEM